MSREWHQRASVAQAAVLLVIARMLVALVPFRLWRGALGMPVSPAEPFAIPLSADAALRARRIGRAVDRAADRAAALGLTFKCLPRAMAAQWLLRTHGIPATLLFGVSPHHTRGTLDDLHAWVSVDNSVIIGELEQNHAPILALRTGHPAGHVR